MHLDHPMQPEAIVNKVPFYEQLLMTHAGFVSPKKSPRPMSAPRSKEEKEKVEKMEKEEKARKMRMKIDKSGFIFFERFCVSIC